MKRKRFRVWQDPVVTPEAQQAMQEDYDRWIAILAKSPYREVDKAYEWCRRNLDANGNLIERD